MLFGQLYCKSFDILVFFGELTFCSCSRPIFFLLTLNWPFEQNGSQTMERRKKSVHALSNLNWCLFWGFQFFLDKIYNCYLGDFVQIGSITNTLICFHFIWNIWDAHDCGFLPISLFFFYADDELSKLTGPYRLFIILISFAVWCRNSKEFHCCCFGWTNSAHVNLLLSVSICRTKD